MVTTPLAAAEWWRAERQPEADSGCSRWAFRALLAFLAILLLAPQDRIPALASLRIAALTAALAIAAHLLDCVLHGRALLPRTREFALAGALAGWALLTAPLSLWPGGSVQFMLGLYLKALAAFWLIAATAAQPGRLRAVALLLALCAIPLGATGFSNFLSRAFLADSAGVNRIEGYVSPLADNPNDLALTLNLMLPLAVGLLLGTRAVLLRLALFSAVVFAVLGVIATFSRAGFVTLVVIGACYAWRLLRKGRLSACFALASLALFALALLPPDYQSHLGTITAIEQDVTGSAQQRFSDTLAALRYLAAHPLLGAGVGMNILALNLQRGDAWMAVHNAYLECGVDLGIPGLVLFAALVFACLHRARSVRLRIERSAASTPAGSAPALGRLAEGIEVSLIGFSVAALFHPVAYQFYFYLLAGLAVAAEGCSRAR